MGATVTSGAVRGTARQPERQPGAVTEVVTITGPGVRDERRAPYNAGVRPSPPQSSPATRQPTAASPPLQERWLAEHLRSRVAVRLGDGKTITGVLAGYDAYCLTLSIDGDADTRLIYKSFVAYIRPGGTVTG